MLPRLNRLTGKKNFERVEKEGEMFQSQNFGIAFVKREDKKPSRFAFVVSTKISKVAVERNRIKRILREAVRQTLFDLVKGFDVVFLAKLSIMRASTDLMMKEVKKSLRDAKLAR
ncbi:MAG: Ribonuclease P protein component [Candidatus Woesebacteria bacterium GW2011_GWB1_41_10]|uniref:Ribonuclease P protein component n=1 Tax=Candidatus Woesebacteria bacterium GW2011_GWB1_41_10 TaxID=1618577 RepID=A0A0G0XHM7_9BACT|nr:MAG: Ribonuclease P protein component [Candidatus Woesebacteria bacterium GW2011_GWB1_41_10]